MDETNREDTEVEVERSEPEAVSIRQALEKHIEDASETESETETTEETEQEDAEPTVAEPVEQRPVLLPPADMRKEEKEAFLNPTPENAHILQSYLNRRAYETRSDYSRKMAELEQERKNTASLYETIKQYETDYAKQGISIADVAKRSVAWDQAMKNNPVETAIEWLESYGITPQELVGYQPAEGQPQAPQQNYLTKEEAERIAQERIEAIMKTQEQKAVEYYNERVVQSFMNTKPVFKDPETAAQIEADMAPIVQALTGTGRYNSPEEILETAYNYVINGNPVYSSLVQKMTAKPAIQNTQAAVQKAKAAAKSISGSQGSGTPKIQTKDLRDNLRRRLMGDD